MEVIKDFKSKDGCKIEKLPNPACTQTPATPAPVGGAGRGVRRGWRGGTLRGAVSRQLAWLQSWFRQSGVVSSRESAGMVPNPAHATRRVTQAVSPLE